MWCFFPKAKLSAKLLQNVGVIITENMTGLLRVVAFGSGLPFQWGALWALMKEG